MKQKSRLIPHLFFRSMLTFAVVDLSSAASALIDGFFVSHYLGETALAAYGMGVPYFLIMTMLGEIMAAGLQAHCSSALVQGDREASDRIFSTSLFLLVVFALFLTALCFAFCPQIGQMLGAAGENSALLAPLSAYSRGFFIGILPYLLVIVLPALLNLDGNEKCISLSVAVIIAVDFLTNLAAVKVFHAGLFGVALATTLSNTAAALLLLTNFFRKRTQFTFTLAGMRLRDTLRVIRTGLPKFTSRAAEAARQILCNHLALLAGGELAMSALAVRGSLDYVLLTLGVGVSGTTLLLSQLLFEEKDLLSLRTVFRCLTAYSLGAVGLLAAAVYGAAPFMVSLFVPVADPCGQMAVSAVRCFAFALPLIALSESLFCYMQAAGHAASHAFIVAEKLGFILPALLFIRLWGTSGFWLSFAAGEALALLCYFAAALLRRKKGQSIEEALMLLPAGEAQSFQCLDLTVRTIGEVSRAALRIRDWCLQQQLDPRTANTAALCMEELAGNVVAHGFPRAKHGQLDIRVIHENGALTLSLRDDCPYYNIQERYQSIDHTDKTRYIGTRMVFGLARKVDYVNIINTNTLIIRL